MSAVVPQKVKAGLGAAVKAHRIPAFFVGYSVSATRFRRTYSQVCILVRFRRTVRAQVGLF